MNEITYELYIGILTKDNVSTILLQKYNTIKLIEIYFCNSDKVTDESIYEIRKKHIRHVYTNTIDIRDKND